MRSQACEQAATIGAAGIPLRRLIAALGLVAGDPDLIARDRLVLWSIRVPRIALACTAMPMRLSIDQAVPLGLIVSELVTNAVKHAFPDDRAGRIDVCLTADDGCGLLSVTDDGIGLSAAAHAPAGDGLGLELVKGLAQQLGGNLEIAVGRTRYAVRFAVGSQGR